MPVGRRASGFVLVAKGRPDKLFSTKRGHKFGSFRQLKTPGRRWRQSSPEGLKLGNGITRLPVFRRLELFDGSDAMVNSGRGGRTDDDLTPRPRPQPTQVSRIVGLINNLEAMYAAGDDAEAAYQAALEELRARADEAVIALARLESDCERRTYPRRWALIYAAAQLQHPATLPFLRQVVLTPIPPEQSSNPHSFSTVKEETVLRTTAVEGVGALAVRGDERARDSLFEFLSIESISIRRASVQSLVALDPGIRDGIREHLPREFHYLLDVRPIAVTDAPQIKDPRRHVRERRLPEKRVPPDPERGDGPVDEPGPKTGG